MEKRFKMPELIMPHIAGLLQLHYVYRIKSNNTGIEEVIRCTSNDNCIYLLNIVEKCLSGYAPTNKWIQLTHEDYHNGYVLTEAITAKEKLDELSITFTPNGVSF